MKKFFIIFALIAIFSVSGCWNNAYPKPEAFNDADETEIVSDNDADETAESDSDDTESDDEDNDVFDWSIIQKLTECSRTSPTPCRDSSTGLMWSSMYYDNWHQTKCGEISDGGYTDWVVPGIGQLMTLIQNCPDAENGGCTETITGKYSKLGDNKMLWSSSISASYFHVVNFSKGAVQTYCDIFCAMMTEGTNYPPYGCLDCFEGLPLRCARCDEGYFWYEDKCVKSPCKDDSCSDIPHSTGSCYPKTPETYACGCESNYVWTGSECVSPCENVVCDMPHSDGKCHTQTAETYKCGCVEGYFWNEDEKTCETPCDSKSCDISHSDGICHPSSLTSYHCGCEENYFWNSGTKECLNPCEENPCNIPNSTGECTSESSIDYSCRCNQGSHWDKENKICFNPCDDKPCEIPHSTGVCTPWDSGYTYFCECEDNFFWTYYSDSCVNPCDENPCEGIKDTIGCAAYSYEKYHCICKSGMSWDGTKCVELPECSPASATPCKDSSTGLVWSSIKNDTTCENLTEGNFADWELPSISQLRTLIQNCPNTEAGGMCGISDKCTDKNCDSADCEYCPGEYNGKYSKLKIIFEKTTPNSYSVEWHFGPYRTNSFLTEKQLWTVNFFNGAVTSQCDKKAAQAAGDEDYAKCPYLQQRCVRCLENDWIWDGGKCVEPPQNPDPCENKNCSDIQHSTGECIAENAVLYSCKCNEGWFWDGEKCAGIKQDSATCEDNQCIDPHSTGVCTEETENGYYCGCVENYFWNPYRKSCTTPCDKVSCGRESHSTTECTSEAWDKYSCICEKGWFWSLGKCIVNACDKSPNSCNKYDPISICVPTGDNSLRCDCPDGYEWDYNTKKCLLL